MDQKTKNLIEQYIDLNRKLSSNEVINDSEQLKQASIAFNEIKEVYPLACKWQELNKEIQDALELINLNSSETDNEETSYYNEIINNNNTELTYLANEIQKLTATHDPNDKRNVIIEIRAGTGGEEAALFAGELYRMYLRYAENQGWNVEQLNMSEAEQGGIKEVITRISGKNIYGILKFENGVHRVQRVPVTESAGRIHTSSASVVILPEVEDFEITIDPEDLKIDLFRAGGPGGQGVNTTDSAVRITHIPTGIIVSCQDERSQLKNKNRALSVLKSRLYDLELSKQQDELSIKRKNAIKTGDRSDKIRTYNFPQSRVTDHRIKESWYNLSSIMSGQIGEILETVRTKLSSV